jgi:SPP1 gp7 family putative phage head morphogenesis protein
MPDTRTVRNRIGDAGLNEFSNSLDHTVEYLAELQGRDGSVRYRQMSKGDPIIGMILRVHKNPIRSASWNIPYPSDATDEEKEIIDLIKNRLFGRSGTEFDTLLGKILSMLEYGFSLFEQYYEPVEVDGDMLLMPVIEQRMQTSIERFNMDDNVVEQITIKKGLVRIPFDNVIPFILNQQGDDMRGESLLRNAHRPWKAKKTYQEWLGIGIQRSVSGIPSMKVPKGTQVNSPNYINTELLLKNICQHENAYMIIEDGYEFQIHESKFNAEPVQKAIEGCNSEMAFSVLAQFVMLGQQGNTGAFALSRDQSDFFLDGLQYVVDLVAGGINAHIIQPWVEINFGDKIDPGRVILSGQNLNKKAGVELSTVLNNLKTSGFIRPTVNDEIQLRSNLDMPELTEEEIEEHKSAPPVPDIQPIKFSEKSGNKARREYIVNTEKEMADFMSANLLLIKDKLLADIESTLNRGTIEIQGLKNIEVSPIKYLKGLQMKLAGIAEDSWNRAKKSAKAAIKFADINPQDVTDKTLKAFALNQAQGIAEKQAAMLKNRAILTASNNSLKGLSVLQTVANTSKAIDDYITSSGVQVDGSLIVVGTANFGEQQFYKQIEDQLWGYEFIGVDDENQSDICAFYSGKTFSVNSPELAQATPPLHPNCRSYLNPIYKSEAQPEIDDIIAPPSIQKGKTIF